MYAHTVAAGRFVKDPTPRSYGANKDGVMSLFTIAVDTGRDETQFYDCVAFGRTAENINKFFNKGRQILVEGVFQNNNQDRTTPGGEKYTAYEMDLLVRSFSFIGDGGGNNPQGGQQQAPQQQSGFQQQGQPQGGQPQGGQPQQQAQPRGGQQQGNNAFQNNFSGQQDNNPFAGFPTDDQMPF